jgi:SAM-dependent methyltransferase
VTDPTGASYDLVASDYAANIGDELDTRPLERGLLEAFTTLVGPGGRVADVGCGPGHVTAYLAARGLGARGLDLSAGMIDIARARAPGVAFEVASMLDLPVGDIELDGALAWFSVIHLDDADRPRAYEELARVVRPGGWLLVGFHVSGETDAGHREPGEIERMTTWWGHAVDLTFHFLEPAVETAALTAVGWRLVARLERAPMIPTEPQTQRCYLLLQRST